MIELRVVALSDSAFFRERAEQYLQAAAQVEDACLADELRGMARVYSAQAERLRQRAGGEELPETRQ